jgi:truncated hemoglobin YjbI
LKWKVEDYIETLKNPNAWFREAFEQKFVADKILADVIFNKDFLRSLKKKNMMKYTALWGNALFHYGIGIENGLKGVIVKNQPELINFEITEDDVVLHNIGGKASKNHDLYSLANRAGILDKNLHLFKYDSDRKLVKNVLQQLTDNIRWAARYPVPNNPSKVFEMDHDVPHVCVYGFHILDVIEPIFGYFRSLQDSTDEYEDYLEEFFKTMKKKVEERMGIVM